MDLFCANIPQLRTQVCLIDIYEYIKPSQSLAPLLLHKKIQSYQELFFFGFLSKFDVILMTYFNFDQSPRIVFASSVPASILAKLG